MRWFLLSLALLAGDVWSSDPAKPQTNCGKEKTACEQRGTETAPIFVKGEVTTRKNKEESDRDAEESGQRSFVDRALVRYTGLSALFAGLLFLAAAVQAGLFVWQLRLIAKATKDAGDAARATVALAKTTKDHGIQELRAYVGVRNAYFRNILVNGDPYLRADLKIANSGQTPAKNVRLAIHAEIRDTPVEEKFPATFRPGATYMAAGSEWNIQEPIGLQLAQSVQFRLENRAMVAFVWGAIEYCDVFGHDHCCKFRLRNGLLEKDSGWDVEPYETGNEETDGKCLL